jgi:hypothetical protein
LKTTIVRIGGVCLLAATGLGQPADNGPDHADMMRQLGITELRRGPSGNPNAPDAANHDESKASPYTSLPDPLTFDDGTKVTKADQWPKRRAEIVEHFDREIYGRVPADVPKVTWEVAEVAMSDRAGVNTVTKTLIGRVDNAAFPRISVAIDATLVLPANASGPVPVIVEFGFGGRRSSAPRPSTGPVRPPQTPGWQEQVLRRGWGYAILVPTSYQADNGAGLTSGIIGLCNNGRRRKPDDWGALRAWAWGASRLVDYLETDPAVDAKKLAIEGLSRYGKATAVTMAYEPRFAVACIGSSGQGGVKIIRRVFGEQVENVASSAEYHWMAGNYLKYAGPLTPNDLPIDAHHLVALCAPRPVYISVGSLNVEGTWIDANGNFLGGKLASPVYELLGKKGLDADALPPENVAVTDGDIAFRMHDGGHTVGPNWPSFLEFAARYFEPK